MVPADVAIAPSISQGKHYDCDKNDSSSFHIQYVIKVVVLVSWKHKILVGLTSEISGTDLNKLVLGL